MKVLNLKESDTIKKISIKLLNITNKTKLLGKKFLHFKLIEKNSDKSVKCFIILVINDYERKSIYFVWMDVVTFDAPALKDENPERRGTTYNPMFFYYPQHRNRIKPNGDKI